MDANADDLRTFLLARLAEDEAVANAVGADAMTGRRWKHYPPDAYNELQATGLLHAKRVLAECQAKRQIMEWACRPVARPSRSPYPAVTVTMSNGRVYADPWCHVDITDEYRRYLAAHAQPAHPEVLAMLALPYADHPSFESGWRVQSHD